MMGMLTFYRDGKCSTVVVVLVSPIPMEHCIRFIVVGMGKCSTVAGHDGGHAGGHAHDGETSGQKVR